MTWWINITFQGSEFIGHIWSHAGCCIWGNGEESCLEISLVEMIPLEIPPVQHLHLLKTLKESPLAKMGWWNISGPEWPHRGSNFNAVEECMPSIDHMIHMGTMAWNFWAHYRWWYGWSPKHLSILQQNGPHSKNVMTWVSPDVTGSTAEPMDLRSRQPNGTSIFSGAVGQRHLEHAALELLAGHSTAVAVNIW